MKRNDGIAIALMLLFIASVAASLLIGAGGVTAGEIIAVLRGGEKASAAYRIFWFVRLPRTLAAVMAGVSLSVAGMLLQLVLGNPLAAPGVIGVNSGAGLCVLACAVLAPGLAGLSPYMAFAGACVAAFGVYLLSRLTGSSHTALILAGVAVNTLLGACMDAIVTFAPDALMSRSAFAIGGFASATMKQLFFAAPLCGLGLLMAALFRREAQILSLGDEEALSLGVAVERFRALFLLAAAMLAGSAVSYCGLLGFVGLIAPHMARLMSRSDTRWRKLIAALLGAVLCLVCDLAARTLFMPYELPVGIVLSFLGAPFFLYLMLTGRRRGR